MILTHRTFGTFGFAPPDRQRFAKPKEPNLPTLYFFHSDILWRFNQTPLQYKLQNISVMETVKQETTEAKKPTEKERLEIVEKKVEIQKKRMEVKKEKLSMAKMLLDKDKEFLELAEKKLSLTNKRIENRKIKEEVEDIIGNRENESQRMLNDKIFSVLISLVSKTIDEDRTILGSEPFYKPLISGHNREIVTKKLIELITKL